MKQITDIKEQSKNKKRVSVFLDGEFYCGLDLVTALKYRLKKGEFISENELIKIQFDAELQACFDRALKFISSSLKTEKQVRDKLKSLGYLDEVIDKALEKLKSYDFIDDEDYSNKYVSTYKGVKGKRLIKLELQKKGVSEAFIDTALKETENQKDACLKIAEKYLKNKEITKQNLLKCYKHLLSKGFDYDDSKSAISSFDNLDNLD